MKEIPEPNSLDSMEGVPRQDIPLTFEAGERQEMNIKQGIGTETEYRKIEEALAKIRAELGESRSSPETPRIVELTPDKWEQYRTLRLRGFETDAAAWGQSVRKEAEMTEEYWREKLANSDIKMFAVEVGGAVAAMAGLQHMPDGSFRLRRVYTVPEMTGKGYSRMLVQKVFDEVRALGAKSIELDVIEEAAPAIGLYTKMGFKEYGRKAEEKGDGKVHTEILMRKVFE